MLMFRNLLASIKIQMMHRQEYSSRDQGVQLALDVVQKGFEFFTVTCFSKGDVTAVRHFLTWEQADEYFATQAARLERNKTEGCWIYNDSRPHGEHEVKAVELFRTMSDGDDHLRQRVVITKSKMEGVKE